MFETIDGIPFHPLIVHAVVALMPLASILVLLDAVWPRFRRTVGPLPLVSAVLATISVPFATSSGEYLQGAIGAAENPLVQHHQALGDLMLYWGLGLVVAAGLLFVVRRRVAGGSGARRVVLPVAVALAVAVSVATMVHIYRVGDSGARAVWEGVGTSALG
ncbi:DUF2231 domain-containing protein [Nakamurella deserti]|uniref:DUF2231 domain-containing protein n=1 Tax=Nakamurella deserti TaxID=2164074 RepID=UPI000DBE4242|nr:DUF2231 domain-containing protein [Nakamurella deserti]